MISLAILFALIQDPVDRWSDEGGRIYSTALGILTLEACARTPSALIDGKK